MKFLDEYREGESARQVAKLIAETLTRPWTLMEVCGGQTHSIIRYGLDELLPPGLELLHGPGCPVCVTPLEMIDKALAIASREDVIFCSFGDMLRVPGTHTDLLKLKSQGKDIRVVYSPLDAVNLAAQRPDKKIVFFAIGFETTAPANGMAVWLAKQRQLENFSVLVSHVLVPPALTSILQTEGNRVQGFLGPGHVCSVMGTAEYLPIAKYYRVPIVITGFEPLDLLEGILMTVQQLEKGSFEVENQYARAVPKDGNLSALKVVNDVFEICDRSWRGIGSIPKSGLKLSYEFRKFDAEKIFETQDIETRESHECISGQVLKGLKRPPQCPAFGKTCTPLNPLGATMVSSEGACAAYFQYRKLDQDLSMNAKNAWNAKNG